MKRSRSKSVVKAVSVAEPLTKVTKRTRQGVQQPTEQLQINSHQHQLSVQIVLSAG